MAGRVLVEGLVGIDVNPGSDQDVDLITVGVSGNPKFWWDESESAFTVSNAGFTISHTAGLTVDPLSDINCVLVEAAVTGTPQISWNETEDEFRFNQDVYVVANLKMNNLEHVSTLAGFYGATPATKRSITGSRGSNAALASLLTELATLGLLTDNTSA